MKFTQYKYTVLSIRLKKQTKKTTPPRPACGSFLFKEFPERHQTTGRGTVLIYFNQRGIKQGRKMQYIE